MTDTAVRLLDREKGIIEGLIVPFTGPLPGDQDLYGTRFSKDTDLALDWFPDGGRPGLYRHGMDEAVEASVVGRETRSWTTDKGRWLQAQLDLSHEYANEILDLAERGALALSSGSVERLIRINKATRDVERWPWVEWSLVPDPGNPEALFSVRSAPDIIKVQPDIAVRIVTDLQALVPAEEEEAKDEAEPEPIPAVEDMTASVRSLVESLSPDALHALAVEKGARCVTEEPEPQPEPTVTITSSAASVRSLDDDLGAEMRAFAIKTATELTK